MMYILANSFFEFVKSAFSWTSLFSFFIGIVFGIEIIALIYLYLVIKGLNKKRFFVKAEEENIDESEIIDLIKEYQNNFKVLKLEGIGANVSKTANLSKAITLDIAGRFYPNSKYPVFEISIDELLLLTHYISKRIDEILSHKGLKMLKKLKISQIIAFSTVKKNVDENAIMQTSKKMGLPKKVKTVTKVLNVINPVYWVKRFVIDNSINIVMRKICIAILGIVGEETYKIYSKSLFNVEHTIDTGIDDFYKELKEDLDNEENNYKEGK